MWQIIVTIFYIVWLFAVLFMLWLIWRSMTRYINKMEITMLQSRAISAEAALKSAEAASRLAEMLQKEYHA